MKNSILSWLGIAIASGTTAWGQVVYINDPNVEDVQLEANPEKVGWRYRLHNSNTDFVMAYQGNFGNVSSQVGLNAANDSVLNGVPINFVIQNRPGQGITYFAQVDRPAPAADVFGALAWGGPPNSSAWNPALSSTPSPLPPATIPAGNIVSAATLKATGTSPTGVTPSVLSYNTIGLAFVATTGNQAGRIATVSWDSFVFTAEGLTQSGGSAGVTPGTLVVNGAEPAKSNLQAIYADQLLQNVAWTLSGRVTLTKVGAVSTEGLTMNISTGNTSFTVVPEPEEYAAAIGGTLIVAGIWLRRRQKK